jgi:hypothetical protein
VGSSPVVSLSGKVASTAGKLVTCFVTRHFTELTKEGFAWTKTIFCQADKDSTGGNWTAELGKLQPGTYLISVGAKDESADSVVVTVPSASSKSGSTVHTCVAISTTKVSSDKKTIMVTGTTINPGTVTCTLIAVNAMGTPLGPPFKQGTHPETSSGTGTFSWSVTFVPSDINSTSPTTFPSGLYQFDASAPGEGDAHEPITV